ncbi:hypothetical protein JXR93_07835 [bacterium]|nr:hypothetical protein [bacterium]
MAENTSIVSVAKAKELIEGGFATKEDFKGYLKFWFENLKISEARVLTELGLATKEDFKDKIKDWIELARPIEAKSMVLSGFATKEDFKHKLKDWIKNASISEAKLLIQAGLATKSDFKNSVKKWEKSTTVKQLKDLLELGFASKESFLEKIEKWRSVELTEKNREYLNDIINFIESPNSGFLNKDSENSKNAENSLENSNSDKKNSQTSNKTFIKRDKSSLNSTINQKTVDLNSKNSIQNRESETQSILTNKSSLTPKEKGKYDKLWLKMLSLTVNYCESQVTKPSFEAAIKKIEEQYKISLFILYEWIPKQNDADFIRAINKFYVEFKSQQKMGIDFKKLKFDDPYIEKILEIARKSLQDELKALLKDEEIITSKTSDDSPKVIKIMKRKKAEVDDEVVVEKEIKTIKSKDSGEDELNLKWKSTLLTTQYDSSINSQKILERDNNFRTIIGNSKNIKIYISVFTPNYKGEKKITQFAITGFIWAGDSVDYLSLPRVEAVKKIGIKDTRNFLLCDKLLPFIMPISIPNLTKIRKKTVSESFSDEFEKSILKEGLKTVFLTLIPENKTDLSIDIYINNQNWLELDGNYLNSNIFDELKTLKSGLSINIFKNLGSINSQKDLKKLVDIISPKEFKNLTIEDKNTLYSRTINLSKNLETVLSAKTFKSINLELKNINFEYMNYTELLQYLLQEQLENDYSKRSINLKLFKGYIPLFDGAFDILKSFATIDDDFDLKKIFSFIENYYNTEIYHIFMGWIRGQIESNINLKNILINFLENDFLSKKTLLKKDILNFEEFYPILSDMFDSFPPIIKLLSTVLKIKTANYNSISDDEEILITEYLKARESVSKIGLDEFVIACDLKVANLLNNIFSFNASVQIHLNNIASPQFKSLKTELKGKILSSFAQSSTILKDFERGISFFKQALKEFENNQKEKDETMLYYLFNTLEYAKNSDKVSDEIFINDFKSFFSPIDEIISDFAQFKKGDDANRYHLLLRAVYEYPQLSEIKDIYIKDSKKWKALEYHPWQIISLYNSLLIFDKDKNLSFKWISTALDICESDINSRLMALYGGVISVIGAIMFPEQINYFRKSADIFFKGFEDNFYMKKYIIALSEKLIIPEEHKVDEILTLLPFNYR